MKVRTNKIKINENNLINIPFITIYKYFSSSVENIYFLILSLFQLLTLGVLPSEWSPTGPYSTAIPLIICILFEITLDTIKWIKNWYISRCKNKKKYKYLCKENGIKYKECQDIKVGDILILEENEIVPVDGICIKYPDNDKCGYLNLSLRTGESKMHRVNMPVKKINMNCGIDTKIKNLSGNDLEKIEGYLKIKYPNGDIEKYSINNSHLIVNGSIIKSRYIYIQVIAVGKNIKNIISKDVQRPSTKNYLDDFIGQYMIKICVPTLVFLVLTISIYKIIFERTSNNMKSFIFYIVQNWILLNGIIPFSSKIMLKIFRICQSLKVNTEYKNIQVLTDDKIDDICNIKKIITDKTGTLTQNKLELNTLIEKNTNIVQKISRKTKFSEIFLHALYLCIHKYGNKYQTYEDEVIEKGIQKIKNVMIPKYRYIDINGLDFTYDRKMSSKIVIYPEGTGFSFRDEFQNQKNNRRYIYCKGSIDKIKEKLRRSDIRELERLDKIFSKQYPNIRLMAYAYKILDRKIDENVENNDQLEQDLNLLGIIGIQDLLQNNVLETITKLSYDKIYTSICTGDRKITSLDIAYKAGIIKNKGDIVEINNLRWNTKSQRKYSMYKNKTLLINGDDISKNIHILQKYLTKFKNFVGYNLIPTHKKILCNLYQSSGIKTLAIGDGYNDIDMFNQSHISVSIKGNNFVCSHSNFILENFGLLRKLFYNIGTESYFKNTAMINFVFYRSYFLIFMLWFDSFLNTSNVSKPLFNGFVIKGFTLFWCIPNLMIFCFQKIQPIPLNWCKSHFIPNLKISSLSNFLAILSAFTLYSIFYNSHSHILAILTIFSINSHLIIYITNDKLVIFGNILYYFSIFAGIILYIFYIYLIHQYIIDIYIFFSWNTFIFLISLLFTNIFYSIVLNVYSNHIKIDYFN